MTPCPPPFFFNVVAVLRQSLESLAGVVYCSQNYSEVGFRRAWLPKLIIEGDRGRTVSCEVNEQWSTERLMSFQVSSSPFFLMLISLPPSPAICFCSLVCTDCIWKQFDQICVKLKQSPPDNIFINLSPRCLLFECSDGIHWSQWELMTRWNHRSIMSSPLQTKNIITVN